MGRGVKMSVVCNILGGICQYFFRPFGSCQKNFRLSVKLLLMTNRYMVYSVFSR